MISRSYVLTAAHCFDKNNVDIAQVLTENLRLAFNVNDLKHLKKQRRYQIEIRSIKAEGVHPHKDYVYPKASNDIAVVEMSEDVEFTPLIQPICIPSPNNDPNELARDQATFVGYGLDPELEDTVKLRLFLARVNRHSLCEARFLPEKNGAELQSRLKDTFPSNFTESQLCAGIRSGYGGSCKGDSGGPLIVSHQNTENFKYTSIQVGVLHGSISHCDHKTFPGIYSRLSDPDINEWLKSFGESTPYLFSIIKKTFCSFDMEKILL